MSIRSAAPAIRASLSTGLLLALLALASFAPASAFAESSSGSEVLEGGGSFNELQRKATEEEETTPTTAATTPTESTRSTSNSGKTLVIVLGAAVVLLSGIGAVIVRDAKRVAPAGEADMLERRPGNDRAVRHRKRRAKSKAARQQRKRNR